MNKLGFLAPLFVAVLAAGCTSSDSSNATLTVTNKSDFSIVELYVTQVNNPDWGRNLVAGNELLPDDATTLDVACDTYDAKLVDDSNVDCEVHDLDLCANDADWVIHNNTCPVFGAARAAREAAARALGK